MKIKFKNLTPHTINSKGKSFPSEGIARVDSTREVVMKIDGLVITKVVFGDVIGLPDPDDLIDLPNPLPKTFFIVSAMVRNALPDRKDLISPGELDRDEDGKVIGAKTFDIN